MPILQAGVEKYKVFKENWQGALKMANSKCVSPCHLSLVSRSTPRIHRPQTILDLLQIIREQLGGVEEYLKTYTGLIDEDIATIRRHYLIAQDTA